MGSCSILVTLVDLEYEDGELPKLAPHALIVAPSRGDILAVPPPRLAAMVSRIDHPQLPTVVSIGGQALQTSVMRLVNKAGSPERYAGFDGELDEGMREMISSAIRLWVASR
jgi:hypothetical protein